MAKYRHKNSVWTPLTLEPCGPQVPKLVEKMHGKASKQLLKQTLKEFAEMRGGDSVSEADAGKGVSRTFFQAWYRGKCSAVLGTPLDVLFGCATSEAYWCAAAERGACQHFIVQG